MKKIYEWEADYYKAVENNNEDFGYNIDFNFLPVFKKIDDLASIEIMDAFTVKITLPGGCNNEELLILILTKLPGASKVSYRKNALTLEWHF